MSKGARQLEVLRERLADKRHGWAKDLNLMWRDMGPIFDAWDDITEDAYRAFFNRARP